MKYYLLSIKLLVLSFFCNAQSAIQFPDINLENALLNHNPVIDTNHDNKIQFSEASSFNSFLTLYNENISDATGIEFFTSIKLLDMSSNQLTFINLSNNLNLEELYLANNNITALNTTNLDFLEALSLTGNQLTTLDLSNNTLLEFLVCDDNNLTELNVSANPSLEVLVANNNPISTLNLSVNTELTYIEAINCDLEFLNLANGNNDSFINCRTYQNPDLDCIQIDFGYTPTSNTIWIKDPHADYSEYCRAIISGGGHTTAGFRIFPNPAINNIDIKYDIEVQSVALYSAKGLKLIAGKSIKSINLKDYKKGLYVLIVEDVNGNVIRQKFLKK